MSVRVPTTHEREIVGPVVTNRAGRTNHDAVGFSRRPVFDGAIAGRFGRRKRWEYWALVSRTHVVSVTLADLDLVGMLSIWCIDLRSDRRAELSLPLPRPLVPTLRGSAGTSPFRITLPGVDLGLVERLDATVFTFDLRTDALTLRGQVEVARPAERDSLSVLVPFSDDAFQLTCKDVGRPATGVLEFGGESIVFDPTRGDHGTLDFGRGVFPHHTAWNWSASHGFVGGRAIGWNLGGQWTDGTGTTENGLFVDGRLEKLGATARFRYDPRDPRAPWRLTTDDGRVELELRPAHVKTTNAYTRLAGARIDLAFGTFHGQLVTEAGERVDVVDHVGWAEDFTAAW